MPQFFDLQEPNFIDVAIYKIKSTRVSLELSDRSRRSLFLLQDVLQVPQFDGIL